MQWAFREYASGKPLKAIAEEMNAQGLRTPRNAKFSVNMLNKMLKNRAYIGEYHHGDIVVEGGMPVLVDKATFDRAQRRFAENKRKGSQRAHGMNENEAPRYWLTGKLYCGECGSTMQGVSGTSKTGRTYYYYYCSAQRRKECHLHKARKQDLEDMVLFALHNIVDDEENVTALALDAAEYYEKNHNDTAYLEALEAKRKEVEKSLANLPAISGHLDFAGGGKARPGYPCAVPLPRRAACVRGSGDPPADRCSSYRNALLFSHIASPDSKSGDCPSQDP